MHNLALTFSKKMVNKKLIREADIDFYRFSIEVLMSHIGLVLSLITVGYVLDRSLEVFIFLVIFSPLRTYSNGFHANSFSKCIALTVLTFLFCVSFSTIEMSTSVRTLLLIIISVLIIVDLSYNNKNVNKIFSILLVLNYILLLIFYFLHAEFFLFSMSISTIVLVLKGLWYIKKEQWFTYKQQNNHWKLRINHLNT